MKQKYIIKNLLSGLYFTYSKEHFDWDYDYWTDEISHAEQFNSEEAAISFLDTVNKNNYKYPFESSKENFMEIVKVVIFSKA